MKIRHNEINAHLVSSDNFQDFMAEMVSLYATCPDASKIRFIQAIEDQFKAAAPARGRAGAVVARRVVVRSYPYPGASACLQTFLQTSDVG